MILDTNVKVNGLNKMKCKKSLIKFFKSEINEINQDLKKSKYAPYRKEYIKLRRNWQKRLTECNK